MHACPCSIMICRAQAQHYSRVQLATATSDRDATPLASELPAAMPMPMPTGRRRAASNTAHHRGEGGHNTAPAALHYRRLSPSCLPLGRPNASTV